MSNATATLTPAKAAANRLIEAAERMKAKPAFKAARNVHPKGSVLYRAFQAETSAARDAAKSAHYTAILADVRDIVATIDADPKGHSWTFADAAGNNRNLLQYANALLGIGLNTDTAVEVLIGSKTE